MPRAVCLDKEVEFQSLAAGQDEYGAPSTTWTTFATEWAEIKDLTGREFLRAGGTQSEVTTTITIRWREGIDATTRAVYDGKIYNLSAVLGEDRRWLVLMCSKGLNNG